VPYLCQRWKDGCHNASQLWREIRNRGYPASDRMVLVWAHQQRQAPAPSTPNRYRTQTADSSTLPCGASPARTASSRQFAWFLLQRPSSLSLGQQAVWERIRAACPELATARDTALQFQEMVRSRNACSLDAWLSLAARSGPADLVQFADGLARDKPAIVAALSLRWSNGQTEGQVNRLKLLKRQSYGRASFALLKARVLPRAACA
jgi:transposase